MVCVSFAVVRRANPVAGAFRFRGSRRELVGENLIPAFFPAEKEKWPDVSRGEITMPGKLSALRLRRVFKI
jgi:hypothetical protein